MSEPRQPGRKPDYLLSYFNKKTQDKGQVGAAWDNDDGTISVRLNALTTLTSGPDVTLKLFPTDPGRRVSNDRERREEDDDNTPF